ncbi:MAG: FIST C-terminal domain-containing protein [Rhodovibrionaceae bacterium]
MAEGALRNDSFAAATAADAAPQELAVQVLAALGAPPEGANLGFLYATEPLADHLDEILAILRRETGIADWTGSVGYGVAGSGIEYHDRPAISVMLGRFPDGSARLFGPVTPQAPGLQGEEIAWAAEHPPVFGVAHGDPQLPGLPELLERVAAATSTYFVGGLAAVPESGRRQENELVTQGLSGVLFDPQVQVVTGLTQGCTPIGPKRQITAAERNVVIELDGRPALEVFKEDIGELLARDLSRVAGYIHVGFPILGSDTGDYLVRNLVGIDPERGLLGVAALVQLGETLMFCRRDHEAAKQDLDRMLEEVTRRAGGPAKAALYYSCVARGQHLFGSNSEELRQLRETLGEIPLTGFFADGEISNDRLYGYTGVLTLLL